MAWNEPGGSNNKNQGPPDLDEALRKLKDRFKVVFGGGNGGNSGNGNSGGATAKSSGSSLGLIAIAVVAVVIWALSGIFVIAPAERGVVLRFGQYVETVGPGLHWIPRGINSKTVVNIEQISNFSYTAEMLNKDENIVLVSIAIQYRVANARDYLFNVTNPEESLKQATASALRQVIGHTKLDDVLATGREQVRQEVSVLLTEILNSYKVGIEVTDVAMQPARAPEEVKAAFDDAINAQEDEQRFVNQAQAYAAQVEPIARGRAQRVFEEAQAYKQQKILQSQGDASRFTALLTEYKKAPEVTRERLYIDIIESVLSNTSKILVDIKDGNNLVYLPLDRMMQKTPAPAKKAVEMDDIDTPMGVVSTKIPLNVSTGRADGRSSRNTYLGRGEY